MARALFASAACAAALIALLAHCAAAQTPAPPTTAAAAAAPVASEKMTLNGKAVTKADLNSKTFKGKDFDFHATHHGKGAFNKTYCTTILITGFLASPSDCPKTGTPSSLVSGLGAGRDPLGAGGSAACNAEVVEGGVRELYDCDDVEGLTADKYTIFPPAGITPKGSFSYSSGNAAQSFGGFSAFTPSQGLQYFSGVIRLGSSKTVGTVGVDGLINTNTLFVNPLVPGGVWEPTGLATGVFKKPELVSVLADGGDDAGFTPIYTTFGQQLYSFPYPNEGIFTNRANVGFLVVPLRLTLEFEGGKGK